MDTKYPGERLLEYNRKFIMDSKNDHDLLVEINTILKELKVDFDNHLQDHKKYMYFAWSTCIGLVITLAITLIKVL